MLVERSSGLLDSRLIRWLNRAASFFFPMERRVFEESKKGMGEEERNGNIVTRKYLAYSLGMK